MELKRIALPIAIISVSVGVIIASLEAQMIY